MSRRARLDHPEAEDDFAPGSLNLLAALKKLPPVYLASVLQDLSSGRRAEIAAAMGDQQLADVLEELPEDVQQELLAGLEDQRAADALETMSPDDVADLLGELEPAEAQRLLALMEPESGKKSSEVKFRRPDKGAISPPKPRTERVTQAALRSALDKLPAQERTRYKQEWEADLAYLTGRWTRLSWSLGIRFSATRVGRAAGRNEVELRPGN